METTTTTFSDRLSSAVLCLCGLWLGYHIAMNIYYAGNAPERTSQEEDEQEAMTSPPVDVVEPCPENSYPVEEEFQKPTMTSRPIEPCPKNSYLEDIILGLEKEKREMRKQNELTRIELEEALIMVGKLVKKNCKAMKQLHRREQEVESLRQGKETYDNLVLRCQQLGRAGEVERQRNMHLQADVAFLGRQYDALCRKYARGLERGKKIQEEAAHYQRTANEQTMRAQTATARANDLQKRFEAKQARVQLLESEAQKGLEYAHELDNHLGGLRTIITDQSEELRESKGKLKVAEEQCEAKREALEGLKKKAADLGGQLQMLRATRSAEMAEDREFRTVKQIEISEFKGMVSDRNRTIKTLDTTIAERDQELTKLEKKAKDDVNKVTEKLGRRDTALKLLEKDLVQLEKDKSALLQSLKREKERSKHFESCTLSRNRTLTLYSKRTRTEMFEHKSLLRDSEERLRMARANLMQKDEEIERLNDVVETLDRAVVNGEEADMVEAWDAELPSVETEGVERTDDKTEVGSDDDVAAGLDAGNWEEVDEVADEDEEGLGGEEWNKQL